MRNEDLQWLLAQLELFSDPNVVGTIDRYVIADIFGRALDVLCDTQGVLVGCAYCSETVILNWYDETRKTVLIDSMDGWTAPPPKCPKCSSAQLAEVKSK